ncbi:MAG: hypothetical protein ACYDEB_13935, partial [Dehalococcoidia bacterium]
TAGVSSGQWDEDAGTKDPDWTAGCASNVDTRFRHMRLYATNPSLGGNDHLYNINFGFYVIGSTHYDYGECPFSSVPRTSGWSEDAEAEMVQWASDHAAQDHLSVCPGATCSGISLNNAEPLRFEGNHVWQSDGYASMVYVLQPLPTPTPPPGPTPVPAPTPCSGKC